MQATGLTRSRKPVRPAAEPRPEKSDAGAPPAWLPYALICAAGLLAFGLSLNADFYMDDHPFILESETVQGSEWDPHGRSWFRTLPYLAYRAIYAVAGPSAFAFHLLNFSLHLGTAVALFALGSLLFRRLGWKREHARRAALFGALIFVVHPLASETVNYARCSAIQMVVLFSTLSALCATRWLALARARDAIGALLFLALATASKDPGLIHSGIILVALALALWPAGGRVRRVLSTPRGRKGLTIAAIALIPIALWMATKWVGIINHKLTLSGSEYFWNHFLTQGRMFWIYLSKLIIPTGLSSDHMVAWSTFTGDTPAMLGCAGTFLLLCLGVIGLRKRRTRAVSLLGLLVAAHLALRFLYPNNELLVEYRAYPALPWFGLLVGLGLSELYRRGAGAGKSMTLLLVVTGALMSMQRSAVWSDSSALAYDVLKRYPLNNRARTQLQANAYRAGEYPEMMELRSHIHLVYLNVGIANESDRYHRRYDPGRALRNVVNAEQLSTYAIAEVAGSQQAIAFADERLADLRENFGPFESEEDFRLLATSLLVVRNVLLEHGAEYDRQRGLTATTNTGEPQAD